MVNSESVISWSARALETNSLTEFYLANMSVSILLCLVAFKLTVVKPHSPATPPSGAPTIIPKPVSEVANPDVDKIAESPPKVTAEA